MSLQRDFMIPFCIHLLHLKTINYYFIAFILLILFSFLDILQVTAINYFLIVFVLLKLFSFLVI